MYVHQGGSREGLNNNHIGTYSVHVPIHTSYVLRTVSLYIPVLYK